MLRVDQHDSSLARQRCLPGFLFDDRSCMSEDLVDDVDPETVEAVGEPTSAIATEPVEGTTEPIVVTVEERAHGLLLEHQRQVPPKGGGVVEGGAGSADALGVIPDVQTVDHLENHLGIGRTVQPPPIIALPPGPDLAAGREHAFARGGGEAVALKRVA